MQDLHIMYGLPSHAYVNPALSHGKKVDTRTDVVATIYKILFQHNKEVSNAQM